MVPSPFQIILHLPPSHFCPDKSVTLGGLIWGRWARLGGGLQAAMYFLGAKGNASEGFYAIAIEHDWPPTDHPSETGVDLKEALFSVSTVTVVLCHKND